MFRWIGILLLGLAILPNHSWSQEDRGDSAAICLLDLSTPPDADLAYVIKAVNATIINRLSQFPNVVIYSGESAPARYFKEPDKILAADKVQLLQIRRETGFDGLIFGELEEKEDVLLLTLHLVDFSSGRIYFTGQFRDSFGSALLEELERKIEFYADTLISYYNCILTITSEPSGAEVWVNGENTRMETPIDKLDVKDGRTQVQIRMQGYIPFETEIELQSGQKGAIHSQLYRYSLTATSQPPGANVYLDDQLVGVTPVRDLTIEQQDFTVKLTKKGFAPYSESISLSPGERAYFHAELYDLLIDHIRRKESPWEIDSHNFSFVQTLDIQDMQRIGVDAFPTSNFRYHAKFGKLSAGVSVSASTLDASQHFDTFLNPGEGYEPFTIEVLKGTAFSHYNIVDKIDWLEIYLGAFAGFSSATSDQPNAPLDLSELQRVSPVVGGEIGASFYLTRMLKLSASAGGYYAGKLEYAAKEASYWGEAEYRRKTVRLYPFYVGLALTLSLWPALM